MTDHASPLLLRADDPEALSRAEIALEAGGIVGLPTETVYGLAVLPQPASLEALIAAKQRPREKGIALLIDDLDQVEGSVIVPRQARRLAASHWPGPLTLVLPLRQPHRLPTSLTGGRDTLALRVPDHALPRALARSLGPIAATSANRSGGSAARTATEVLDAVGPCLAVVLDDGLVHGGVPSTIVAVDAAGHASVQRQGPLGRMEIEAFSPGER